MFGMQSRVTGRWGPESWLASGEPCEVLHPGAFGPDEHIEEAHNKNLQRVANTLLQPACSLRVYPGGPFLFESDEEGKYSNGGDLGEESG